MKVCRIAFRSEDSTYCDSDSSQNRIVKLTIKGGTDTLQLVQVDWQLLLVHVILQLRAEMRDAVMPCNEVEYVRVIPAKRR